MVCCGGGGIPVAVQPDSGELYGMEAVVDKDEASALLGIKLQADWLLMLTGVRAGSGSVKMWWVCLACLGIARWRRSTQFHVSIRLPAKPSCTLAHPLSTH